MNAVNPPLSMRDAKPFPVSPTSPSNKGGKASATFFTKPFHSRGDQRPQAHPLKSSLLQGIEVPNLAMAAIFLQYCAMCEKQILTPSNAILYCSEACRRKDSCKPLASAAVAMNLTNTPPSVRQQNASSNVGQTQWRPRLLSRSNSEAFRYLSQFYRSISAVGSNPPHEESGHRHLFSHRSTASMTTPSLSLSQTTSTTCSSLSTGADFDPNTSPLQSRHDPMYSASVGTKKRVDLVVPSVTLSVATSLPSQFDDRKYEKRSLAKMSA